MSIRQYINDHPWLGPIVFVMAVISVGGYFYLRRASAALPSRPRTLEESQHAFFYDISNGALFSASKFDIPPINTDSGELQPDQRPTGVRARVFSCGSCEDEASRFIGYLETFSRDAQNLQQDVVQQSIEAGEAPRSLSADEMKQVAEGRLVAAEPGKDWFPAESPEAKTIIDGIGGKCAPKQKAVECFP